MSKFFSTSIFFYMLFSFAIGVIFLSHPFLRVPYDMWYHLMKIDYFTNHSFSLFEIHNRELWHYLWGSLFSSLHIDDLFLKTEIIHITQSLISFFIIYFTSSVIIRNLFKKIEPLKLKYLSLWSVFIWFTIFATFSVHYHQVWILWYSINYQITLLFFWYIVALLLIIVLEKPTRNKSFLYLFQIFFFSIIILWMHAPEFIYLLMYCILLCLLYIKEIYYFCKKYYVQTFLILTILVFTFYYFITGDYIYRKPPLFHYLNFEHITELYPHIISYGHLVTKTMSRASASLNELIYLSILLLSFMGLKILYNSYNKNNNIPLQLYLFILISALFIFIPTNTISAGITSMLFAPNYINRFYYSSSIFIVLPLVTYYFFSKKDLWTINLIIIFIITSTLIYSKYFSSSHNYYKNIHSITKSFKHDSIGFNLTQKEITLIGKQIKLYEKLNTSGKPLYYYARNDIALILKLVYKKPAFWIHHDTTDYIKKFHEHNNLLYTPILFNIPKGFFHYEPYK